jgi:anhydro-N-acetylmuramic acid kinase
VANDLNEAQGKVLFSGGGIHNDFLMERISALSHVEVIKADPLLADYKEALVFAFLGALWLNNENNVLGSVTGARSDHRSGVYCAASQK